MMRPLMNIVLYGRSSYDASIRVPLPAYHHRRFAAPLPRARSGAPIPDNQASIVSGGNYAPAVVAADNHNASRDGGGAHPAHRDGRFTVARSERRPGQIRILFGEFVGTLRNGALPA